MTVECRDYFLLRHSGCHYRGYATYSCHSSWLIVTDMTMVNELLHNIQGAKKQFFHRVITGNSAGM